MRWHDVIAKAIASLFCLLVWRLTLRTLSQRVPTYAGEQKYFPKHLINDDYALNRYRLNISEQIYPRLRKQADHVSAFSPLEIRIIASDRRQNYLPQVITFLVDAYQSHKQLSPSLEICNVEPEVFEELRKFKMHVPIRTLGRKSSRSSRMNETIAKEAEDYWKCLNHTTKGRYIMLLEDDALVVPEFARLMTSLMDQLDRRQHIDYVKMYHPNQLRKIPSIPLAISICILVCCTYCIVIFRRVLLLWSLLTSSLMYLELRSYGSQFLADVRYYLTDTAYLSSPESCCTPAVLFRASKVAESSFAAITRNQEERSYRSCERPHTRRVTSNVVDVRVITAERNQDYLIQVVTSVLAAYHESSRRTFPKLELCNVEAYPFDQLRQFQEVLPVESINVPSTDLLSANNPSQDQIFMKEAMDYWKCSNFSTQSRSLL